jgi:hypothetical protein
VRRQQHGHPCRVSERIALRSMQMSTRHGPRRARGVGALRG